MKEHKPQSINRRHFIRQTGLATAGIVAPFILPSGLLGQGAPSKKITLGFIGMGLQGTQRNLGNFLNQKDAVVLAVCDVKMSKATDAKQIVDKRYGNSDCKAYQDFRKMIGRKDIDAIVISTPDHWHVPLAMAALREGKDVFCEKPSLTISEGRDLVNEVNQHQAVFQWGIEDRSLIKYHRIAGWVRDGAIGKLQSIEVSLRGKLSYPKEAVAPVPDDLDWNLWLGPAPFHPYTATRSDPQVWRSISDYSGGSLTDWGAHLVDTAQVGAGMEASGPVQVSGSGHIADPNSSQSDVPETYKLHYRYANDVDMFVKAGPVDIKFIGSDGWVSCGGWNGKWTASSKTILRIKEFGEDTHYWPRPPIEQRDFLDSMKSRKPPAYHVKAGHRLASTLHLGHMAIRSGKTIKWNPGNESFVENQAEHKQSIIYKRTSRDWESV